MLIIKDVKASEDHYFIENPNKALVKLKADMQCAIENEFYLLNKLIIGSLHEVERKINYDQFLMQYKHGEAFRIDTNSYTEIVAISPSQYKK